MRPSTILIPKKRGPKPKGAIGVMVRLPPEQTAAVDAWAAAQPDLPSRPEALRRLAALALAAPKAAARKKTAAAKP
jgi:hypothetical protein